MWPCSSQGQAGYRGTSPERKLQLALQHWMITAKLLGHEGSLNNVKSFSMNGLANKGDSAAALRRDQNAMEEMSSKD